MYVLWEPWAPGGFIACKAVKRKQAKDASLYSHQLVRFPSQSHRNSPARSPLMGVQNRWRAVERGQKRQKQIQMVMECLWLKQEKKWGFKLSGSRVFSSIRNNALRKPFRVVPSLFPMAIASWSNGWRPAMKQINEHCVLVSLAFNALPILYEQTVLLENLELIIIFIEENSWH